ncbi:metal-dependent transcriptional regulator [Clostridium sp. YIM B02551]|uniref:metal-dependent transcriptional regulator n=1 Tax=Clostridium sp. YIM B02551 TaxID=2910679 RepID=UPI001EEBE8A4|nr:iron dependent repressor, metal binding and dimerization domain protein [Clostridium sp. YIM B02551]
MESEEKFYTVRGYQLLKENKEIITSGMEDYLEMIYRHGAKEGYIRINILAKLLNVKPSSVTKMVQKLSLLDMVDYKKYGVVILTEKGKELGAFLLNRHNIIESFLNNMQVDSSLQDVELIEHDINKNILESLNLLNEFFKEFPRIKDEFGRFKEKYKKV